MKKAKEHLKETLTSYHSEYYEILLTLAHNCSVLRRRLKKSKRKICNSLWERYYLKLHENTLTQIEKGNFYNIELLTLIKLSLVFDKKIHDLMFHIEDEE